MYVQTQRSFLGDTGTIVFFTTHMEKLQLFHINLSIIQLNYSYYSQRLLLLLLYKKWTLPSCCKSEAAKIILIGGMN